MLADGPFTVRNWMELRLDVGLITLSSCEVGISSTFGGDEIAGFMQALLMTGGHAALLGLWTVNALTTKAFMENLYQRMWVGRSLRGKASAVREAAMALRRGSLLPQTTNFDLTDPYYWAPFALYGDWH
jgi:CHAT domain-containing protein